MKGNPALIIVTHLKPIVFSNLWGSEKIALASQELIVSFKLEGFEYQNEK